MRWASPPERLTGRAVQGQVIQTDIHQETQAGTDLLQDPVGDGLLAGCEQGDSRRPICLTHSRVVSTGQSVTSTILTIIDRHRQCFRAQAFAVAGRAGPVAHEFRDLVADVFRVGFAVTALQVGDDAFEGGIEGGLAPSRFCQVHGRSLATLVPYRIRLSFSWRNAANGCVQVDLVVSGATASTICQ